MKYNKLVLKLYVLYGVKTLQHDAVLLFHVSLEKKLYLKAFRQITGLTTNQEEVSFSDHMCSILFRSYAKCIPSSQGRSHHFRSEGDRNVLYIYIYIYIQVLVI